MNVRNTFSKVYEKVLKDQLVWHGKIFFTVFICVEEKLQLTKQLNSFIEEWRKNLDNNFLVGAVLTDLLDKSVSTAPAFNCMLHDLLIAEL